MITKFQIFEEINKDTPEVWDYVILDVLSNDENLAYLLKNSIGQIIDIDSGDYPYRIRLNDELEYFQRDEIKYWSKNKEDLEVLLSQQKYNL